MRKLVLVLSILTLATAAGAAKKKVAVPKMKASGADIASMASPLTEILTTELESLVDIEVIGSSDISAMLGFEKEKELLGCEDDITCIAEIGGALGVDLLLVSEIGRVGGTYVLTLKLIDTQTGAVLKRGYKSVPNADALIGAVKPALAVVVPLISPKAAIARSDPTPAPKPEPEPEPVETAAVEPPTEVETSEGPSRWPQWTMMISGGALLVTSGALALLAKSSHDKAVEAGRIGIRGVDVIDFESGQDERRAALQSRIAVGSAITGVLLGTGGLIWLLVSDDGDATVTPQVSGEAVGLNLTGRF